LEPTNQNHKNNQKICICLHPVVSDKLGLGQMLADTFSETGYKADFVDDGAPQALQADILLLTGNCSHFNRFPELLDRHKNTRPKTILWQLDPLAPLQMTKKAEKVGLKLGMLYRTNLPVCLKKLIKAVVPPHEKLEQYIKNTLTEKFKKEMAKNNQHLGNLDAEDLCFVMEQHRWFKKKYSPGWCDFVFASTTPRCRLLNSIGIPARYVPVGYHKGYGEKLDIARDIDVLFIGYVGKKSRLKTLNIIRKALTPKGINITIAPLNCYDQERTKLLNRARIVLDIIRIPWEMPIMRLLMSMGCGAMVVSNWTGEPTPFSNEHFVQAELDKIPETIEHYLKNEDERATVTDSAYRFVTEKLTLRNSILQILEQSGIKDAKAC
jgi:hypothetical protein